MSGRRTLSWANKEKALLSHGESGYEWVDRDDPRAREVRLLDEVGRVGAVTGSASDNLLIRGDSLDALRALAANESKLFGTWRYLLATESDIKAASNWNELVAGR